MRWALVAWSMLGLGGCASQVMQGYVGKSIEEPILDYGPPAFEMDLGSGRRAFQWRIQASGAIPVTTPSTTRIYGSGGYAVAQTTTTTYAPYSHECLYTLTATQQGGDWIVDGYRKPTMMCE